MLRLSSVSFTPPSNLTLCQQLRASTRDLHDRVEAQMRMARIGGVDDASSFFGAADVAVWQDIRSAIDRFGRARPDEVDAVISGARRTFAAIGDWTERSRWCTQ